MKRRPMTKKGSRKHFRSNSGTHPKNEVRAMRGGRRL